MGSRVEEFCREAGDGSLVDRVKVLAICLAGATELGGALEVVLRPAQNVELLRENLSDEDFVRCTSDPSDLLTKFRPSLLLLCLSRRSIDKSGIIFKAVREHPRGVSTLVVLETAAPDEIHRFIDMGVADFCLAPLRLEDLLPRIMRWSLVASNASALERQLEETLGLHQMIGRAPTFVEAVSRIPKLARSSANVLITGETGTGKEMCARAIHQLGSHADQPFVPVNCGAIPSELVENELFGHHAGAFTGACSTVRGLVDDAEGGTLFLDEIDSLPLQTQVKFLRFLQDQEYRPLGARKTHQANIRVIAASNADLDGVIRSGKFRPDLFYRLNILPLKLPALRERRGDIPLLARHFVARYARETSTPVKELSRNALDKLVAYEWPGNIRELQNMIERALVLSQQPMIAGEDIWLPGTSAPTDEPSFKALKAHAIGEFESAYVRRLLTANDGNISKAARAARKNRRAFWELMRKHQIAAPAYLGGELP
jgi:DNA-binding NtrC family response regulator